MNIKQKSIQIEFSNISKTFGAGPNAFRALDNIELSVEKNEFFTLLGPSGCGKTTLLRMLAGFGDPDDGGKIILDGKNLVGVLPNKRPVNTVFQSYALFPHMTVAKNIAFGLEMLGWESGDIARRQKEVIELVQLEQFADRKPAQLSGGQQQRVALARALAPKPKVLLLDEPLSALDLKLRKEMQIEMTRIRKGSDTTFLFVTHDQEEALTMSDRIAVMNAGRIQQVGTPDEIYYQPATKFVADFIGDMNFLETTGAAAETPTVVVNETGERLSVQTDQPLAAGKPYTLAIRPEFCRVLAEESSEENIISGSVRQRVFSGAHTTLIVDLAKGGTISCRLDGESSQSDRHQLGSPIKIGMSPADLLVVGS